MFGVFRVKNHDFTQKKSYFSNFRGGWAREIVGVFHMKNHDFMPKKSYFFRPWLLFRTFLNCLLHLYIIMSPYHIKHLKRRILSKYDVPIS